MPNDRGDLPPDGTRVRAMTYASIEYDREPEQRVGKLSTRPVPTMGYVQCWVDGVQVDPDTVRVA